MPCGSSPEIRPRTTNAAAAAQGRAKTSSAAGTKSTSLAAFVAQLRGWLDLPDPGHVLLTLAAAATRDLDGEALWLLLVAPPSSGKTEGINMLDDLADDRLNEVTAAGLLGWGRKGREPVPTGVLIRVGRVGLVTFGDLSSLLATSDSGRQAATFSLLRRVYDGGPAGRDIQPPGGNAPEGVRLSWSGRLTVVAAVTGAIDRFSVHDDELGPRWVYCRLPPGTPRRSDGPRGSPVAAVWPSTGPPPGRPRRSWSPPPAAG